MTMTRHDLFRKKKKIVQFILICFVIATYRCSTNADEVSVTIAGSVCNVSSSTATTITCVTGAQQQSQETKVRVSIADRGVAKMVRRDTRHMAPGS